ncbi:MAG: hypothetical protein EAZ84_09905 [Verrucomicrobia bacterium]|nr:MAG: hypothetical protein EAZ84_09905 [Verrucomicrobiota bacterium]
MSTSPRVPRGGDKKCPKCATTKQLSEFNKDSQKSSGYRSHCKTCTRKDNERLRKIPGRAQQWKLKNRFNLTLSDYDSLLEQQGNGCAICGKSPEENGKRLAVDHNHRTGEVRGLLCTACNTAIGLLSDSPSTLRSATRYLEERGNYADD